MTESKNHRYAEVEDFIAPHTARSFTAPWAIYFSEILHSTTAEEAARHYLFCSGYLQAMHDANLVTAADFKVLREQLHARLAAASQWLAEKNTP